MDEELIKEWLDQQKELDHDQEYIKEYCWLGNLTVEEA